MAAPAFVGAGSGVERLTTGTATVSKTGCTAGNILAAHLHVLGTTGDWSGFNNAVNIETLAGTGSSMEGLRGGGTYQIHVGRVTANGTCSVDFGVGASGEDIAARLYEFSGGSLATDLASVFENGAGTSDGLDGTSTTVGDTAVVTNGSDRLALQFVALESAQAVGDFTGETGGDWTEAVAEYVGTTLTLQLQTATMASSGTIDGGTITVSSTYWLTVGTALIPPAPPGDPMLHVVRSNLRW